MIGGEKFHRREESQQKNDDPIIGRRDFLKAAAATAVGFAIGAFGAERATSYVKSESAERSNLLEQTCEYLLGKSSERRTFMGKELSYKQFLRLLGELADPPARRSELKAVLDSFTYMLKVEDSFGGPFNTLPVLEELQLFRERNLQQHLSTIGIDKRKLVLADSFGFGQIQPRTAANVALAKAQTLKSHGMLTDAQIAQLRQENLEHHTIAEILDLRGDGNVLISFLCFYDCVSLYSRSTGGAVHGGLSFPERRGSLQPIRSANPRGFTLAVAAYSAGLDAPMVAKAQTYINELIMTHPFFRAKSTASKPLAVDGDVGSGTLHAMKEVGRVFGFDVPDSIAGKNLKALDAWLLHTRQHWREGMDSFLSSDDRHNPETIRRMTQYRYSLQVKHYTILKRYMGDTVAHDLFVSFIDQRNQDFLDVIDHPDRFMKISGRGRASYDRYIKRFSQEIDYRFKFDEQFKGYIPTHFKLPRKPLADPMNVPARVILAFDLDESSPSRIR